MTDLLTLKGWLLEAETAQHKLAIGQLEASVSYEGKSVTFTQADSYRLDAYVAKLKGQIADLTGVRRRRGPMQFVF